jgi:hypothetical protein
VAGPVARKGAHEGDDFVRAWERAPGANAREDGWRGWFDMQSEPLRGVTFDVHGRVTLAMLRIRQAQLAPGDASNAGQNTRLRVPRPD